MHNCICIGIIYHFLLEKKFDFLHEKYTNSYTLGKKFDLLERKYKNSLCLGKKNDFPEGDHISFPQ